MCKCLQKKDNKHICSIQWVENNLNSFKQYKICFLIFSQGRSSATPISIKWIYYLKNEVFPKTGVKFKSAFLQAFGAVTILWGLLCICSDSKSLNGLTCFDHICINSGKLCWQKCHNCQTRNSWLITHAQMQRWIWNLQLPTDSTFE